jgi:PRC-barrel domain
MGYGDVGRMGVGASASGMGIGMSLGHHTPTVISDNVPEGESEVARHERVHAVDGEIGRLKGFAVDPADHRITHVLLREGHLWGRREVAIPVSAVASVDDGIRLNITKQQVEELPPRA